MNILVYSGPGVSTLQSFLLKALKAVCLHDVKLIDHKSLHHNWEDSTTLFIMPGGRDLEYLNAIDGPGIEKIQSFVRNGGSYMGICAGAYFASNTIEFQVGTKLEVSGDRPLKFFKGKAIGSVSPDFCYDTELSATVMRVLNISEPTHVYVNGGCYFEGADTVLASYESGKPAVIECNYGKGKVILMGPHFELDSSLLSDQHLPECETSHHKSLMQQLEPDDDKRRLLFCSWLNRLGVNTGKMTMSTQPFVIYSQDDFLFDFLSQSTLYDDYAILKDSDQIYISSGPLKRLGNLQFHWSNDVFDLKTTFMGRTIAISPCTTSTQTILETNRKFYHSLPQGTVLLAQHQLDGRGRGSNRWVSQQGCLQFSLKLNHSNPSTLVFIQYLFSLSIAKTQQVYIKWPNDIYMNSNGLKKIGGILISSEYNNNSFDLVIGCGLNANTLDLPSLKKEPFVVLGEILQDFESAYELFTKKGFDPFYSDYYHYWLHNHQIVTIEGQQGKIIGLSEDGFLKAQIGQSTTVLHPDGNSFDMFHGLIRRKIY